MREILFRGKRIDNGEWVVGIPWIFSPPVDKAVIVYAMGLVGEDDDTSRYCECHEVDPSTISEFTGLTDKNGKKIFEGDIIKIVPDYDYSDDYSISKVYSYNGIFCVDYHGDDFDSTALGFLEDYLPDGDFEVIGNVHDGGAYD